METDDHDSTTAIPSLLEESIDFRGAARAALGSAVMAGLVGGGLYILGKLTESYVARVAEQHARRGEAPESAQSAEGEAKAGEVPEADLDDAAEAAALLGVELGASADEIRAALRAKLGASRLHPDHGGDGIRARELIDAKNLLIAKLHEVES